MSRIYVNTLGGLRIERDGDEIPGLTAQPVRCALFLYLAFNRTATRDELTAFIWPERGFERARHSLNQTLYELRRQLGENIIQTQGELLKISPETEVDALEFLKTVDSRDDEPGFKLYYGSFLQGVHFGVSGEFESWVNRTRYELERKYRDLCRRLTGTLIEKGDNEEALTVARRWVSIDPLEDEAQHLLIKLLAQIGRRSEALQQFNRYSKLIAKELDVEPLDETKELVRQIKEETAMEIPADQGRWKEPLLSEPKGRNNLNEEPENSRREEKSEQIEPFIRKGSELRNSFLFGFLVIVLTAVAFYWIRGAVDVTSDPMQDMIEPHGIAVLPFVNMSADPEQEYFADGITEDLLTSLTKLERTRVISRTTVMRYKNSEKSLPEIAAELNVAYVLEGSVRRDQNNVRITAQLIEVADDKHLWAETYDRVLTDIFEVKSDIAHRIAEALEQRLLPGDRDRIARGGTDNLTAYDFLLRGRDYLNRPGEAERSKYFLAKDFFRQALDADPEYARAYAAISEVYRRNVLLPLTIRRDSMLVYAQRAVQLDPELAEAATELGYAYLFAWDHDRSEKEFHRALEFDPNQTDAMSGLGRLSVLTGDLAGAIRWELRAVSIDPLSTERMYHLGNYLFNIGDLERSEALFERIITLVPEHPTANYLLAHIHLIHGRQEMADEQMRALEQIAPSMPTVLSMQAKYQTHLGRYGAAKNYLARTDASEFGAFRVLNAFVELQLGLRDRAEELIRQPSEMLASWEESGLPAPPRGLFHIHLIRGETEAALSVLRHNWRSGLIWIEDPPEIGLYWIDRQPIVEPLLDHPDFQTLLNHIRSSFNEIRMQIEPEISGHQIF